MNNKDIIVIHPYLKRKRINKDYFLEEAVNLVKAIDLNCVDSLLVGLDKISSKTYFNEGFIRKIKLETTNTKIDLLLINTNLSPIQHRNLEKELNQIITHVKEKNSDYDCIIGVSGGKDSTKQAITARDVLGLRCLLVNFQPDNIDL